jgi:hypothetical protein
VIKMYNGLSWVIISVVDKGECYQAIQDVKHSDASWGVRH